MIITPLTAIFIHMKDEAPEEYQRLAVILGVKIKPEIEKMEGI